MTHIAFNARCVALEDPDGACHMVGFADQQFDPCQYLLLQRALEHDAQDIALGMDTFHVEWCGQQHSIYGGIARCVPAESRVDITFVPEAAQALDGLQRLSIHFDLPAAERTRLYAVLERIFAGTDCLVGAP